MVRLNLSTTQNGSKHMALKLLALFLCVGWCEIDHSPVPVLGIFFLLALKDIMQSSWFLEPQPGFPFFILLFRVCMVLVILYKYSESLCIFDLSHHL